MPRHYSFLKFASGVDWQDVNPTLLLRMNRLGMALRKVITITSGARTDANNTGASQSHHIPSNNPSGMGEAVDAYIGGKQLGSVVSERMLKKYGLYSGNRPGFYKGKPDPMHIETIERRSGEKYTGDTGGAPPAPAPAAPPDTTVAPLVTDYQPPGGPPTPDSTLPPLLAPGSVQADSQPRQMQETWQLLAAQPLASPETQMLAQRLSPNAS